MKLIKLCFNDIEITIGQVGRYVNENTLCKNTSEEKKTKRWLFESRFDNDTLY